MKAKSQMTPLFSAYNHFHIQSKQSKTELMHKKAHSLTMYVLLAKNNDFFKLMKKKSSF
jgi:hypothetical protein